MVAVPTPKDSILDRDVAFASDGRSWLRGFQAPSTSTGPPLVAVDSEGGIVVGLTVSYYEAAPASYDIDIEGSTVPGGGSWDALVAKYDASGTHLWSRPIAGPGDEILGGIAVAADGRIIVSGTYGAGADLGRGPETGVDTRDGFLASYRPEGGLEWVLTFGSATRFEGGGSVDVLADGSAAWTGVFAGPITLGAYELDAGDELSGFVARVSPDGEVAWLRQTDRVQAVATDPRSGRIVIASSNSFSTLDPPDVPATGLTAFDGDGAVQWTLPFTSTEPRGASVRDLAVDSDGSVLVAGRLDAPTDFGDGELHPAACCSEYGNDQSVGDSFALRVAPAGGIVWSRRWGGDLIDEASSVAVANDGTLIVGGSYTGLFEVAGLEKSLRPLRETGEGAGEKYGGYLLRMTADGTLLSLAPVEAAGQADRIGPVIVASAATEPGEVLVGGRYFHSVTLPFGGRVANSEWLDYFLARVELP